MSRAIRARILAMLDLENWPRGADAGRKMLLQKLVKLLVVTVMAVAVVVVVAKVLEAVVAIGATDAGREVLQ